MNYCDDLVEEIKQLQIARVRLLDKMEINESALRDENHALRVALTAMYRYVLDHNRSAVFVLANEMKQYAIDSSGLSLFWLTKGEGE